MDITREKRKDRIKRIPFKELVKASGIREPKTNEILKGQILEEVFQFLVRGRSRSDVVNIYQKKHNLNPRTTDRYIAKAKERFVEYNQAPFKVNLAWHVAYRFYLLKQAQKRKDHSFQLDVAKDLARLQGLYSDRFEFIVKDETLYNGKANELLNKIKDVSFEEVIDEFGDNGKNNHTRPDNGDKISGG